MFDMSTPTCSRADKRAWHLFCQYGCRFCLRAQIGGMFFFFLNYLDNLGLLRPWAFLRHRKNSITITYPHPSFHMQWPFPPPPKSQYTTLVPGSPSVGSDWWCQDETGFFFLAIRPNLGKIQNVKCLSAPVLTAHPVS